MKTPIIETERMILRPLTVADASDIFERWTSDDRVSRYVRWCTHSSVNDTIEWLKFEEAGNDSDKQYQWGFTLKDSGYLFGSGGINFNEAEGVYELGYNIMHKYWNQGYTTEAAKAILEFAIEELNQKEFVSWHAVDNPASGAVMKKCGFVYECNEIHTKFDGVPQHVSLKQPFVISKLEDMEEFFDGFAKELSTFDIEFVDMDVFPSDVLGGEPSGCMSLRVKETPQLVEAQRRLNEGLYEKFGPCPAEHDDDYIFHMTFAIGGARFEAYQRAYDELIKLDYKKSFRFSKLGLLYYDDDNIKPGTYFCYKVCEL